MKQPCISVIMGVYNCPSERMLTRAVQSILDQTFRDFEFLICDDGSQNETYQWLEKLAAKDERIVLLRNRRNMSLAYSLNRCIEHANGLYIARQDADDYSELTRFAKQIDYLNNHPSVSLVGSNCNLYRGNGEIYDTRKMPLCPTRLSFLYNSPYIHGTLMLRREVFDQVGIYKMCGFCGKYEDYDLLMRIYQHKLQGVNIQECLYTFNWDLEERHIKRIMRIDETVVRLKGFCRLHLMPKGLLYALKPVAIMLLPHGMVTWLKRQLKRV